jgi:type IV secretion system protein VirD4
MRMPGPVKDKSGMISEPGDTVIYCAGFPAIYGRPPLYFQDETFRARAAIEAPSRTDQIRTEQRLQIAA